MDILRFCFSEVMHFLSIPMCSRDTHTYTGHGATPAQWSEAHTLLCPYAPGFFLVHYLCRDCWPCHTPPDEDRADSQGPVALPSCQQYVQFIDHTSDSSCALVTINKVSQVGCWIGSKGRVTLLTDGTHISKLPQEKLP